MRITPFHRRSASDVQIKLSEVMSALSLALDLVEGQPEGHAVRGAILGMRIGRHLRLSEAERSSLFYALLMKDLGCSSNAAKMCFLFSADDRSTKGDIKTVDWRNKLASVKFAIKHVAPGAAWWVKAQRILGIAVKGERAGKELIQIRCERGAAIARLFGLSEQTADAIHALDEHHDGGGHPDGLIGDAIPLLARILGVSQTAEVFLRQHGLAAMRTMLRERRGTWFDPELVDILLAIDDADDLWRQLAGDVRAELKAYEPQDEVRYADDAQLDDIALGFAQVIDAKSPWTFRHSQGVSDVAVGIGRVMGFDAGQIRDLKRAGLLHDVGKLGVSNLILDKPGKLDADELAIMRQHPKHTQQILSRVTGFSGLAELAAAHHERLDGKGYHRGLDAGQLPTMARILCVADMYEALAAKRPYREDMSEAQVMSILTKQAEGGGICPHVLAALRVFLDQSGFTPHRVAA